MNAGGKDRPGVIAHPPYIYLGFLGLGIVLNYFWPLPIGDGPFAVWARSFWGLIVAGGATLLLLGIRQFRRRGTHFRTDKPSTAIITDGLYRYSRNPLYLALSLIYAGLGLGLDNLWALMLLVPVLVVIRYGVIAREEAYLERKFGHEYLRYKRSVRRWI